MLTKPRRPYLVIFTFTVANAVPPSLSVTIMLAMWVAAEVYAWLTVGARCVTGALPLPARRRNQIIAMNAHRDFPVVNRARRCP